MTDYAIDIAIARHEAEEAPYEWYEDSPEEAENAKERGLTLADYHGTPEWERDAEEAYDTYVAICAERAYTDQF